MKILSNMKILSRVGRALTGAQAEEEENPRIRRTSFLGNVLSPVQTYLEGKTNANIASETGSYSGPSRPTSFSATTPAYEISSYSGPSRPTMFTAQPPASESSGNSGPSAPSSYVAPQPPLADPGALSEEGKAARDAILKGLSGQDAAVQSAQNIQDRNEARGRYLAAKAAQEQGAAAGFAPGSIQASRLYSRNMGQAGVGAMEGQNAVNDLARDTRQSYIDRALDIENQAYANAFSERNFQTGRDDVLWGRGYQASRDARGDFESDRGFDANRADTTWEQNRTTGRDAAADAATAWNQEYQTNAFNAYRGDIERTQRMTDEQMNRTDIAGLSASIESPKARNAFDAFVAEHPGDVAAARTFYRDMFDANGTLKPEYRDQTPAQDAADKAASEADVLGYDETVEDNPTQETRAQFIQRRIREIIDAEQGPISQGASDASFRTETIKAAESAVNSGDFSAIKTPQQWDVITADKNTMSSIQSVLPSFAENDPKLATGLDFQPLSDLGLKFDSVTDDGRLQPTSAGNGNGSIIIYNGRPMRLISWANQKKVDTEAAARRVRRAQITGRYLDGNQETVTFGGTTGMSGDGWVRIDSFRPTLNVF